MSVANDAVVWQPYDLGVRAPRREQVGRSLFDGACMRRIFIAGDKANMFSLKAIGLLDNRHAWHDARALQDHERRDPGEASTHGPDRICWKMFAAAESLFVDIVIVIDVRLASIDPEEDARIAKSESDHDAIVRKDLGVLGGQIAWIARGDAYHAGDEFRFALDKLPRYWTSHGVGENDDGLSDDATQEAEIPLNDIVV